MMQEQKLGKRLTHEDYDKAIEELLNRNSGAIHHSDLSAYLGVSASTALSYLRIYAKRYGKTYQSGWLFNKPE